MATPVTALYEPCALEVAWSRLRVYWISQNLLPLESFFAEEVKALLGTAHCAEEGELVSLEEISYIYESHLNSAQTEALGAIYTPLPIVQKLCDTVGDSLTKKQRILDPACGGGIFLLETARRLRTAGVKPLTIAERIHGIDKDIFSVQVTKMLLATLLCENVDVFSYSSIVETVKRNVMIGDALLPGSSSEGKHAQGIGGAYDLIVGNPPYGLSRDNKLSPTEVSLLKKRYGQYLNGRINKYLLFMARSYELLQEKDSSFLLIVPNAWLGIKEAETIRHLLLEGGLYDITILDKNAFPKISVETVIVQVKKNTSGPDIIINNSQGIECSRVSRTQCLLNPGRTIPTRWHAGFESLFMKMRESPYTLGDASSPFMPRIALQAYAEGKGTPAQTKVDAKMRSFHSKEKLNPAYYPYLEGKDITPHQIEWSGNFLHYGEWLAEPQKIERFEGPRILIREIIQRPPNVLIAAFTHLPYLYNKSVLHILPKEDTSEDLMYALTALLQSSIVSTWLRILGRKTQRTVFPKIVLDDLKSIPIPDLSGEAGEELSLLAREAEKGISQTLRDKIDAAALKSYALDESYVSILKCA